MNYRYIMIYYHKPCFFAQMNGPLFLSLDNLWVPWVPSPPHGGSGTTQDAQWSPNAFATLATLSRKG